jgi:hypothetical protein
MTSELDDLKKQVAQLKDQINPPPRQPSTHQPIDYTANASMPPSAMKAMVDAVPDAVMKGIRGDAQKPNPVTGYANPQPTNQVQRGTGWVSERGFPDRTKEFELMDRIVASQVGGPNEKVK